MQVAWVKAFAIYVAWHCYPCVFCNCPVFFFSSVILYSINYSRIKENEVLQLDSHKEKEELRLLGPG